MIRIIPFRFRIFFLLLLLLLLFSLIPLFILYNQSVTSLDSTRELSRETIESTINKWSVQLYKTNAQNLADRISDFLYSCESDAKELASLPARQELYLQFVKDHYRWIDFHKTNYPLYKEISLIDKNGNEIIVNKRW